MSGDLKGAKSGSDTTTIAKANGEPRKDPLREEFHQETRRGGTDKPAERTGETDSKSNAKDPYAHVDRARAAGEELKRLEGENKQPTDKITVVDAGGRSREMTVKERTVELKTIVKDALKQADAAAGKIKQAKVEELVDRNLAAKIELSRALGLDHTKVTLADLEIQKNTATGDRLQKVNHLIGNLQQRQALEAFRHAPAFVKMVDAELTASGYTNTGLALGEPASKEDIGRSFNLMKDAGALDPDLKATDIYANTEKRISLIYAEFQQDRSKEVIELMNQANRAVQNGGKLTIEENGQQKTYSEEELRKQAVDLAEKLDIGFLATQARLPENLANGVSQELVHIVYIGNQARLDYSEYLANHGRSEEALLYFNKVKVDSPEMIYNQDLSYTSERMQKLDNLITRGANAVSGDFEQSHSNFLANIDKGKTIDAQTNLLEMQKHVQQLKEDYAKDQVRMDACKQELKTEIEAFEKKGSLEDSDRVELDRLKREVQVIDLEAAQRQAFLSRRENTITYTEGLWYEAKEDRSKAHEKFKTFDQNEKDEDLKKNLRLSDRLGSTAGGFKGWWHQNWGKVAVGASLLVGAGITIATLGAGAPLAVGIVGATVAASVGAGATHWAIERTVHEDAGVESFMTGAKYGAIISGMICAPVAVVAAAESAAAATAVTATAVTAKGVVATAAAATEATAITTAGTATTAAGTALAGEAVALTGAATTGAATTAATSTAAATTAGAATTTAAGGGFSFANAGNAALQFGGRIGKFLGISKATATAGFSTSAVFEAASVATGDKDVATASRDFVIGGITNATLYGSAAKWGNVAKRTEVAAPMFTRLTGITGRTAAVGFGGSALMETNNLIQGNKTVGEAGQDFVTNGVVNTALIGSFKKFGGDSFTPMLSPKYRTVEYAGRALALNETFDAGINQVIFKYGAHDLAGADMSIGRDGVGFISPLIADSYESYFGNGLNPRHRGESRRFATNLDNLGGQLNETLLIPRNSIQPKTINQKGLFFDRSALLDETTR